MNECKLNRYFKDCQDWKVNEQGCLNCKYYEHFENPDKELSLRLDELESKVEKLSELIIKQTEINQSVVEILKNYL